MKTLKSIFTHKKLTKPAKVSVAGKKHPERSLLPGWISPKTPPPVPDRTPEFKVPYQTQIFPIFYHSLPGTAKTRVKQTHVCATSSPSLNRHARTSKAGHWCDRSYASRQQAVLAFTGAQKVKKQRPKYLNEYLEEPPHLADELPPKLSDTVYLSTMQGLPLDSPHLSHFQIACIALRTQYPYPLARKIIFKLNLLQCSFRIQKENVRMSAKWYNIIQPKNGHRQLQVH